MTQQNKPHYTCPRIAVYMHEYFNVRYLTEEYKYDWADEYVGNVFFIDGKPYRNKLYMGYKIPDFLKEYTKNIFCIAPESLDIFKPKDGDMDKAGNIYDKFHNVWDEGCIDRATKQTAIRDNKPFFWYEE